MKKFLITYRNLNIMFGDNVFTAILEGDTAKIALMRYAFKHGYILEMIEAKEVE